MDSLGEQIKKESYIHIMTIKEEVIEYLNSILERIELIDNEELQSLASIGVASATCRFIEELDSLIKRNNDGN